MIAFKHANKFVDILLYQNETECIKYIDKYNNFYDEELIGGWNSLMFVIYYKRINIVKELILKGANVNYKNSEGTTALYIACRYGHEDIAIILIKAGAYFVNILDELDGYGIEYSCQQVIQYLRDLYRQQIISIINDDKDDNTMAISFRTTYAVEVVDIISEFII
ncbi:MAG: hypothetical protein Faunusvirus2_39 [Faunusvirus sp.]|jgi:ankyrin repeat protein|uniref:Uncharacterized protein n=1 Tax=Faunusvirus sp. TaxID=2487766 RepID=A0A3G4ZW15_9VIRU|nr:MAG: hypothetical protein Faunusvirus2_39 [Faunusvirus sp.]